MIAVVRRNGSCRPSPPRLEGPATPALDTPSRAGAGTSSRATTNNERAVSSPGVLGGTGATPGRWEWEALGVSGPATRCNPRTSSGLATRNGA